MLCTEPVVNIDIGGMGGGGFVATRFRGKLQNNFSHALFSTCEISSVNCLEAELKSSISHKDISDFYLQALGRMCCVCLAHLPRARSGKT